MNIYDFEEWRPDVADSVAHALGGVSRVGDVTLVCAPKAVDDDTAKFLIRDRAGRPAAVLLGSPPKYPGVVERNIGRSLAAAAALGPELGAVVLEPLARGDASGRSYAILPYNSPASPHRLVRRLQKAALTPPLYSWLRRATAKTRSGPIAHGADPELVGWLEHLAGLSEMEASVRRAAERALARMSSGAWKPCRVLVHGDFWMGNVLIKPVSAAGWRPADRLTIIDWGGMRLDGAGIFDLLQLLRSLGAGVRRTRREVLAHCEILDCDPADAHSYLALAMGALGLSLENFPMSRFVEVAGNHFRKLRTAIPEGAAG